MKNKFLFYTTLVLIAIALAFSFASCGSKDDETNETTTVTPVQSVEDTTTTKIQGKTVIQTVVVIVTDKNGNYVTDANGQNLTETKTKVVAATSATKKTKKTKTTTRPTAKGGTDPYVEDIF